MQKELLKYQQIDKELLKIKKELNKCQARTEGMQWAKIGQETEANLVKLDNRVAEMQTSIKTLTQTRNNLAQTLEEYVKALQEVHDEEEINYLSKKVATLYDTLRNAEQECQAIAKEAETMEQQYRVLASKLVEAFKKAQECNVVYKEQKESVQPKIDELMKQKQELEGKIDKDTLDEYKSIFKQNIFPVYVQLKDKCCGGCQMNLSGATLTKLEEKGFAKCENCRRIVYAE